MIMGSGGPSIKNVILAADKTREKNPKKMGPFVVPRTMASTASATLAVPFKIKGVNYTISSACATSGHCIGNAMELIQLGKQKIIFAGGGDYPGNEFIIGSGSNALLCRYFSGRRKLKSINKCQLRSN